ncbi:hypothetical protein OIU85_011050 [Salix viminalis]|uniref:Uncharacterized protein n=1 Tax=Salix viminalis TaxID=40686 RepID=A0A9Q0NS02_SALVM|nr:hypothetical protein OIU85_011050 [Salix viminalis]
MAKMFEWADSSPTAAASELLGGKYRDGGWVLRDQRSRVISHSHSGRSEKSSPPLLLGIEFKQILGKEDILQRVQDSSCGTKFDRGNHAIVTIEKTERVKPGKKMKLGKFMSWLSRHDPARLFLSTIYLRAQTLQYTFTLLKH